MNFHVIKVTRKPHTNTKPSCVLMRSDLFQQSVKTSYSNYNTNVSYEVAEMWLKEHGFNVIGHAEGKDCNYII